MPTDAPPTIEQLTARALNLWQLTETLVTRLQTRSAEVATLSVDLATASAEAAKLKSDIDYWQTQSGEAWRESRELQTVLRKMRLSLQRSETALAAYTSAYKTYHDNAELMIAARERTAGAWQAVGIVAIVVAVICAILAAVT